MSLGWDNRGGGESVGVVIRRRRTLAVMSQVVLVVLVVVIRCKAIVASVARLELVQASRKLVLELLLCLELLLVACCPALLREKISLVLIFRLSRIRLFLH